ncbi:MAG: hypothetical protein WA941_15405 [Nitrososphaeraceae archaeon]
MRSLFFVAAVSMILLLIIPNAYASNGVQGSESGFRQGEYFGDPDRPSEQSQYTGKLACYEAGERDGENARFDQDSYDECNIQGENHYENGFEYGCESQRSVQDCNNIRLSESG